MKFLHTSDWHLGVKTNGKDRLPEQKKVIDEILSIANYENVDCVIIAGDVFNSANPSAEAEELFFDSIERLSAGGQRFVFVLAGNHDDPTRLSAGLPLASKHNIALASDLTKLNEKSFKQDTSVEVIETGRGHIKIKKDEQIATIAYLPYPSESRISVKLENELGFEGKVQEWAKIATSAFSDDSFNIFVSHLFLVGSKVHDGEVKVGDIMAYPVEKMPKANYTALGHIHTPQCLGNNIYYSGALTELTVNQKNLGVNVFEVENNKITSFDTVKFKNIAKYERVVASGVSDAEEKLEEFDDGDIIELEIVQNEPLLASELKSLRKKFPCISSVSLKLNIENAQSAEKRSKKHLSDAELFTEFYKSARGTNPSAELVQLFLDCRGGQDETN